MKHYPQSAQDMSYGDYVQLMDDLKRYAAAYYDQDEPLISDDQYNALFRLAQSYESENPSDILPDSITQKNGIAGRASASFTTVKHRVPMLSIDNSMNEQEAQKFHQDIVDVTNDPDVEYEIEYKYDGLAIEHIYKHGQYVQSVTRGDGEYGEDVTHSVQYVLDVPKQIPDTRELLCVRGEILMSKSRLAELNQIAQEKGTKLLSNTRNAAAGGVRTLDAQTTRDRQLYFRAYGIGACTPSLKEEYTTQSAMMAHLHQQGFISERSVVGKGFAFIQEQFDRILTERDSLNFDIDGMVVKVNAFALQTKLGWRSRVPNWATAYKFPASKVETTLLSVDVQIGKTGQAALVGRIAPVFVGGVVVSNVTLHNLDWIQERDIHIGDTIIIYRAGDVIPYLDSVVVERRPADATPVTMPAHCPHCGSHLVKYAEDAAHYFCTGGNACAPQKLYTFAHFASRKCMNIDGMAEKTIHQLIEAGMLNEFIDFYRLDYDKIQTLPGMGKSSVSKLKKAIEASKTVDLNRFLYALSIPQVGEGGSKILANNFGNVDNIMNATYEKLFELDDVGTITANCIVEYFAQHRTAISALCDMLDIQAPVKTGAALADKIFVITGTHVRSRDELKKLIETNSGKVASSVSKKVHYLVAGEKAGSKLDEAKKHNVPIISETDLLNMIG